MKLYSVQIVLLSILILGTSCVRNSRKKKEEKLKDSFLQAIYDIEYEKAMNPKDTIDFSKIEISEDSLDLALFNLVLEHEDYSDPKLIENIELLIGKGANPNAVIEYQYSVRKLGTYIPIIKHFYSNRYRTYTDNSTPFHEGVNSQKINVVQKMIEMGADVNAPAKSGVYPVDLAVKNSDLNMLKMLKENNCNFSVANIALSENLQIIEWLAAEGADVKNININFALEEELKLKRLLELKPDLSAHPLDYSKIFQNEKLLDILLEAGMNDQVRGKFPNECPPIYGALKYGDLNTIKKLKEAGLNINEPCDKGFDKTPFIYIVNRGDAETLRYYLEEESANPNEKDWTGKSALIMAVTFDNDEIIRLLIDAGAEIEYTGYFDKTPLMHAVQYDKYLAAQTLIDKGANIDYVNRYKETALVVAIKDSNLSMIKLLIESGADMKKKYKGLTMSQFAKSKEVSNLIIEYLEQHEE
jgi:ankyrin repeat protein